ncbi:MAG: hypothetical protein DLM61_18265 [Pseudonocardiales bacterium]|nr:MAG: hypothetical protein DLM61_18265 [Pseudonocardiales bacterium]
MRSFGKPKSPNFIARPRPGKQASSARRRRPDQGLKDPELLLIARGMAWGLGEPLVSRRLHARAVARALALAAAGTLAWALEYVVADEIAAGGSRPRRPTPTKVAVWPLRPAGPTAPAFKSPS